MMLQVFECRVCLALDDESAIWSALQKAFPAIEWSESDSSWDKIRVTGKGKDWTVRIYRYESPGPFLLTITLARGGEAECAALRAQMLSVLGGVIWKPLEPQPVELVRPGGQFPEAYRFESDLDIREIKRVLDDAAFWYWDPQRDAEHGLRLVAFGRVVLTGSKPEFSVAVGHWDALPRCSLTCDQVHEAVQNTILPAFGARNVRTAE
jgi:hypothetical protein